MIVRDLLNERELGIRATWAPGGILDQRITGAITTDLPDPSRYLESGRILLTGLVWWRTGDPSHALDDFVRRSVRAGVAALLAGEAAHGPAPGALVAACREQGMPLLSVPSSTGFHQVSEYVHHRLSVEEHGGGEGAGPVEERMRRDLTALVSDGVGARALLEHVAAALSALRCDIVTTTGRVVASGSPSASPGQGGAEHAGGRPAVAPVPGPSPLETWWLRVWADRMVPARPLQDAAEVVGLERARSEASRHDHRRSADHLVAVLHRTWGDRNPVLTALSACGIPDGVPLSVVTAVVTGPGTAAEWARHALEEALRPVEERPVVGSSPEGTAVGVVSAPQEEHLRALRESWNALHTALGRGATLYAGVSTPVSTADLLPTAVAQSRFALGSVSGCGPEGSTVMAAADMRGVGGLLAGLPAEVRRDYHQRTLGELLEHDRRTGSEFARTLRVFLDQNGSWVGTARALHLHVNTVHYRVRRIEGLTGTDLSVLDHRLDLRAALMCG
ncbi:helix-turn-helix domain-containing protein [Nocardiopsis sp. HNM0947]|uniref:Helix-turn-helix domain-containing protein n=1 Tax=Nocardiopsis coralli TaxID=2772213 RepID=A0ABR9PCY5_9ACTN|nr:PucR family transcriptional regulator [Nocardiopsis coralli]MBE3001695.1 helix-turn-helix domain-containing protein [Nocardiopsis coralli]